MRLIKEIKFVNQSPNPHPSYAHTGDSGMDLRCWLTDDANEDSNGKYITLEPMERYLFHTGLYFELPWGTEMQVRSRSGAAIKRGLVVINQPGTVDAGYRGEVCVGVINLSNNTLVIRDGERIAQAVIMPVYCKEDILLNPMNDVQDLQPLGDRKDGGFGSTGKD